MDLLRTLSNGLTVDVAERVRQGSTSLMSDDSILELAEETCAGMLMDHADYDALAKKIALYRIYAQVPESDFVENAKRFTNMSLPFKEGLAAAEFTKALHTDDAHDDRFDYFGLKTAIRLYLLKDGEGMPMERPQQMFMRVALSIYGTDLKSAQTTYDMLAEHKFTHASPTLFNAGTEHQQFASCFLLQVPEDSVEGIYKAVTDCARISKFSGGIGLSVSNVRARGAKIDGINGQSSGIVPMLKVFNDTARYINQAGKRKGAFAIYLEPWHADIVEFLQLKKNNGKDEQRARDLFYGLWVPDLFMHRVEKDLEWSLMCPKECPGLDNVYGEQFEELYETYEGLGKARSTISARKLWREIITAQIETGTPYMLYKDSINRKNNQKALGTIKCSNLCTEIVEYTSPDETSVCTLASVSLKAFVVDGQFDFNAFGETVRQVVRNLNRIIDLNSYPVKESKRSNLRHRPIGIGVQGLADAFFKMRIPFESDVACRMNRRIFETLYFFALDESCRLAEVDGPYSSFGESPASRGILQHDFWESENELDWSNLRSAIKRHGLRNSLLIAPMPTASTSQLLGNTECFEPINSNLYVRRTLSGEFTCVNRYLRSDLMELGLWTAEMKTALVKNRGSVQNIQEIPPELRALYKTVWEMSGKTLIDMSADRAPYIDQSQSLNVHMTDASYAKLSSMHFYGWKKGLKTGMYYLRTRSAANAEQFTCVSCSG